LEYARALHAWQFRKGTTVPYLAHLLGVASLALENGATQDEAIAALLHDALEDQGHQGRTAQEIRERFGADVLATVQGCTDADGEPGQPKPPWRQRKEAYLAHLEHASPSVRLVSACDKLHNARALLADYRVLGEALWPRFNGGRDGTLWYYGALVDAFSRQAGTPVVAELQRVVAELLVLTRNEGP